LGAARQREGARCRAYVNARDSFNLGLLYWKQGKLAEAKQKYKQALRGYEKVLHTEHRSTLETVNNLCLLYWKQGKLAQAEQMYERVLRGYEKALGLERMSTLATVNYLGLLYWRQGKLSEFEQLYRRALPSSSGFKFYFVICYMILVTLIKGGDLYLLV
jgi:tetratricopeptide (TPR) repeat protein